MKSHREQGLDYWEGAELSWCQSWSNSLWQGWSGGLVYCPGENATDPIWSVLASSDGISSWTPLKPQHNNPNANPNPLANHLWSIDFLTPPIPLIIPHRHACLPWISYATQKLMVDSCKMFQKQSWSIPIRFLCHFSQFKNRILLHIVLLKCPDCIFWNSPAVTPSRAYSNCWCNC